MLPFLKGYDNVRERILNDLKEAMKAQDKEKLSVIRMLKGSIQMEELNKKHELSDEEVINVVTKEIKSRNDSIKEFEKGNRNDLIEKTKAEIEILKVYLPEQLSDEEAIKIIDEAFELVKPETAKDMGKIMKEISPKLKGRFDMGKASSIIKERLKN